MSEALDTEHTEAETPAVVEAAEAGQQQDNAPSAEDRAMAMGWTPKSQFRGDPEKWVDAETFVKRGEEFLPFLKANNKRLESALERATTKISSLEKAVSGAIAHISKAGQRAYVRAKAELEAELEQYTTAGNLEGVKAVTKDIVALETEVVGKAEDAAPQSNPDFDSWKTENEWFGSDKGLTAAFNAICEDVYREGYTSPKAGLKEAEKRLREDFPEKFKKAENPNRRGAPAVEGPTSPRARGKTYTDLPPEARKMCDDFCRDIKGFTREKFVKDYDWS